MENKRGLAFVELLLESLPELPGYNGTMLAIDDVSRDECLLAIKNARADLGDVKDINLSTESRR